MKRNLLIFVFFIAGIYLYAQVPQGFNYQAVARDNAGLPIVTNNLWVRLSILSDTTGFYASGAGTYLWEETHTNVKTNSQGLFTIVLGTGTKNQGSVAKFSDINWSAGPLYVGTKISTNNGSTWKIMGSAKLWTVPYSMVSAKADALNAGAKVVSTNDATSDALFEVKRKDGQTVFAVYPDAVNIYVPSGSKGVKGGFAIGGFGDKAPSQDYFRVTPDSVRIYIDNSPNVKGTKGGFAIGGFDGSKGTLLKNYYMNVSGTSTLDTVKGSPQILWFPNRNAFLAGNVWIGLPDSVGLYSTALGYRSIAMGDYSQAFGYKAKALGNYSTSIGKNSVAGAGKTVAMNAFAFGDGAKATGSDSYAFGSGATASGYRSFAFGSVGLDNSGNPTTTPTTASQPYTVAIGMGAQATQKGAMALGIGSNASGYYSNSFGYYSIASGYYSTALGYNAQATNSNALAMGNGSIASGTNSTAIGYQSKAESDKSIAIGSYYSFSYNIPIINLGKGDGGEESKGLDDLLPIRPITPISILTKTFNRENKATGQYSVAIGNGNLAEAGGFVFGSNSDAKKFGALALGHSAAANETNSVAIGYNTQANGIYSMAIGNNVTANSYGELALGQWNENVSGTADTWHPNELLFSLGNGVNDANRSNALTIYKDGKTIVRGRYAVSTFNYSKRRLVAIMPPSTYIFKDYIYGIYTNISRDDPNIEYYYSGYFTSTGTEGTYYGLYADTRSGGSIDVAEYIYDSNGNTQPADVVVADPYKKESVIKSSKPYQTGLLGVISTNPHLTMGMELVVDEETGEPKKDVHAARLAVAGRVPVNVTGENGPIQPGDFLTSSSTPGYAMKWTLLDVNEAKDFDDLKRILAENERRRGAIIGKALESFSGTGTGKIMVLISLQ
ncbi:MAG TPA: hypothetical protein P5523_08065 [Bacteroidales bacterium]|nr:hypothetical protein [Bacteroidales bacterium]HRR51687.1 hypothetical protein [Candidatus Cloacimonas sp.]HRT84577.1 hypothetical protein [Bacteroidales bacterium]